ncbi:DUF1499 domain-containing protein [Roseobacter sp. HKCCD9010]|uniref:DUF1499 domain-containing protein n=1 Tax=unclassified Roseobacter TaxID=196798 RepID=UPI0014916A57|nr:MULTISPECIES: DUF1499 domain-containing protein [unclassified Roseobacter]MBF9050802.1 DUF1499 domain-containing protein [Rhodobacterales bacterium HKCCD4356]NNW33910.1 DUF1499 domain-containing protein [Roseobacter sp. HKCCD8198]NNY02835.1 DUF1499 domain-containing protein [Roseobacter sp. HKCCD7635]NOC28415.1 DUF1499 domain-containing protein [Roseobacter sp. HKCCD9057]NPU75724.1 DUF1499 domain-containing protein [Roseobacter sp. HKCCD6578]
MRLILFAVVAIGLLIGAMAVYMRVAPMPPEIWHLTPAEVTPPDSPNYVLLIGEDAPRFAGTVDGIAAQLDEIARGDGAHLIAGSVSDGHITYVQRTRLMGYPDAISVQVHPTDEAGQVAIDIFSRSRFGHSDMGVNAARVERWLSQLGS